MNATLRDSVLLAVSLADAREWQHEHPEHKRWTIVTPYNYRFLLRGMVVEQVERTPRFPKHPAHKQIEEMVLAATAPRIVLLESEFPEEDDDYLDSDFDYED